MDTMCDILCFGLSSLSLQYKESKVSKVLEVSNELYDILKQTRYNIAKEEGVAPYMVFGDGTLKMMASKYPTTKENTKVPSTRILPC